MYKEHAIAYPEPQAIIYAVVKRLSRNVLKLLLETPMPGLKCNYKHDQKMY